MASSAVPRCSIQLGLITCIVAITKKGARVFLHPDKLNDWQLLIKNYSRRLTHHDPRIAIVDAVCDVEESKQPFGKRWWQELVTLKAEHLAALQAGKLLALDVQNEYVMFVQVNKGESGLLFRNARVRTSCKQVTPLSNYEISLCSR